tara:strand:+ start:281 stop:655 length:375 start_codon:yes stop_codon:yes gene_type:complete
MALARTDLTAVTQIGSATTSVVVTVPASGGVAQTCYIKSIMMYNCSKSDTQNVDVHIVPNSGGSAGSVSTVTRIARVGLATDDTYFFEPAYPITLTNTGDTLQIGNEGNVVDSINVYVTGDIDI